MSAFAILCWRDADPAVISSTVRDVEMALLRANSPIPGLTLFQKETPGQHTVLKLDSSPQRHFYQASPNESWIFTIGGPAYRGKPLRNNPELLPALLEEILLDDSKYFRFLDGSYVVVVYDHRVNRIKVLQQPLAFLPVYYRETEHGAAISTSVLALAATGEVTVDPFSVQSQYRLGHRLPPYTLFSEIRSLPPWHAMEVERGRIHLKQVWAPVFQPERNDLRQAADDVRDAIKTSVQSLIPEDANVLCDITGGFDSRMVAAALRAAEIPFAANVTGYPDHPDVVVAARICEKEGISLRRGDPVLSAESACCAVDRGLLLMEGNIDAFYAARLVQNKSTSVDGIPGAVTVSGIGGEFYRDFNWAHEFLNRGRKRAASIDNLIRYRHDADSHRMDVFAEDWQQSWRHRYAEHLEGIARPFRDEYNTSQVDAIYLHKLSGLYGTVWGGVGGYASLLAPLTNLTALEISLKLQPKLKYEAQFQRLITHRLSPGLARYATLRGGPAAPMSLATAHLFLPRIPYEMKRLARKMGSVWFKKSWFPVYSEPPLPGNPFAPVLSRESAPGGCLHFPSMATAEFYRPEVLKDLLERSRQPGFRDNRALAWILTMEHITRVSGAKLGGKLV